MLLHTLCIISQPLVNSKSKHGPETSNWVKICGFFLVACDLEIWRITLKTDRASLLCYFKLCASIHNHRWVQTRVTIPKRPIRINIGDFWTCVTLQFDGWPWKNNRAHFLCFCRHCASFLNNRWIQTRVTVRKHQIWGQNRRILVPCDIEIWRMTLKKDRAPHLCLVKPCA